jgi:hypothetical protein
VRVIKRALAIGVVAVHQSPVVPAII